MIEWLLWLILFGLVVGAVARFLVPGPDPAGVLATMALGIVGSFVGGIVDAAIHGGRLEVRPAGFLWSLLGAVLVIILMRLMRGRTHRL